MMTETKTKYTDNSVNTKTKLKYQERTTSGQEIQYK